jgi:hypothetical protein
MRVGETKCKEVKVTYEEIKRRDQRRQKYNKRRKERKEKQKRQGGR